MKSIMKNMGKSIAAKAFSAGVCLYLMSSKAFASNVSALKQGGKGSVNVEWPWMKFFAPAQNAIAGGKTKISFSREIPPAKPSSKALAYRSKLARVWLHLRFAASIIAAPF